MLLKIENVSKSFPGVKALDNVSFNLKAGSVHALMGENGAGKSTLMKCLFGLYSKDSGKFILEGKEINFKNSKEALEGGIAMVQQELNQAATRSVMDNVWLGRYPKRFFLIDHHKMYVDTKKIFYDFDLDIDPHTIIEDLSVSDRQLIEIAKAVSYNAKVIVFDEPTSSLTDAETEGFFKIIEKLKNQGCGIIYISHKMDEVMKISDEITVLRDGKFIKTNKTKDVSKDDIIKQMVGRELTNLYPKKTNNPKEVIFKVNKLNCAHTELIKDVSFEVKKGEILGIAGLVGSGRSELLETLFGMREKASGDIYLNGEKLKIKNPKSAIDQGIALITEERRKTGIFPVLPIVSNITFANLNKYKHFVTLSKSEMERDARYYCKSLRVKTPTIQTPIGNLSGGNQQKVIIGRWLNTNPDVFLMDEPTRGIDVGAKYEIYELMIELAEKDKVVIMASSEMPELLGVTDRILVMSGGKVSGIVNTKDTSQEEIMQLAAKYV